MAITQHARGINQGITAKPVGLCVASVGKLRHMDRHACCDLGNREGEGIILLCL